MNKTLAEFSRLAVQQLQTLYPEREIKAMIRVLLEHYGNFSSAKQHAFPETIINEEIENKLTKALQMLSFGQPLQYVTGETYFCGLRIEVNEKVLIPRPETEELVQWAINELSGNDNANIIDLCTGSGCIAIALAKRFPQASVSACDISEEALTIAQGNAQNNHVHIHFSQCNILTPVNTANAPVYSLIICNPPYVRLSERVAMHKNVLDFEPAQALFVDDADSLVFYRAIVAFAQQTLAPDGCIMTEINEALGRETAHLFRESGFAKVSLRKDINGKDRMLKAEKVRRLF